MPRLIRQGETLKQAKEYRRLAEECRALARTAQTEDEKSIILKMAEAWEMLADHRMARQQKPN